MANPIFFSINLAVIGLLLSSFMVAGVESVGVCYGRVGDNLPPASEVIDLYKSNNIGGIRLYAPEGDALEALKGTNIQVIIDISTSDLSSLASDPSVATSWVQNNIQAFSMNVAFKYIVVGNQITPGSSEAQYILPAMKNVQTALQSAGLQDMIKVSTSVSTAVLASSYPPSAGAFSSDALTYLQPIIDFLVANHAPLLVNVYTYDSYVADPTDISIEYALFTSPGTVVSDGELMYQNLFDATVDAVYSALEKAGGNDVGVVVSETGWPSDGGSAATSENAQTYFSNLINHLGTGTPKKPGFIEAYLFSMFDENLKEPHGTENHFGLFDPNKQPKYSIGF